MLWLQIFCAGFFFLFGTFIIVACSGSSALPACVLAALFFYALFALTALSLIGFRSQYVTLREDGVSFRLAPLSTNVVFPWKLKTASVPWNEVRALDIKLRNLSGPQRVYVLRTSAGDVAYYWPQWPDADAIAQEIITRSGATTSTEDMDAPPVAQTSGEAVVPTLTTQERLLRSFGTVMLVIFGLMGLLTVIALFGSRPDHRWDIAKVFLFILIGAPIAYRLRRYRRIR